ncbi:MAG: hypothetical protein CMB93_04255 [Flammeovirgaceae bacterium]|nr:hypothetical protein [Flammeovirgaceae bacterium]
MKTRLLICIFFIILPSIYATTLKVQQAQLLLNEFFTSLEKKKNIRYFSYLENRVIAGYILNGKPTQKLYENIPLEQIYKRRHNVQRPLQIGRIHHSAQASNRTNNLPKYAKIQLDVLNKDRKLFATFELTWDGEQPKISKISLF